MIFPHCLPDFHGVRYRTARVAATITEIQAESTAEPWPTPPYALGNPSHSAAALPSACTVGDDRGTAAGDRFAT